MMSLSYGFVESLIIGLSWWAVIKENTALDYRNSFPGVTEHFLGLLPQGGRPPSCLK